MKNLFLVSLLLLLLISCKTDPKIPEIKGPIREVNIHRFEKELFGMDTSQIKNGVNQLLIKYPVLSRIFFQDIMSFAENIDSVDEKFYFSIKEFIQDSFMRSIAHRIDSMYGDMSEIKKEFERTQSFAKHYFPASKPIDLYTMISGFNVGNIIFSNTDSSDGMGISLDFYLGNDYNYKYVNPNYELFSNYITRSFNKHHIQKKSWMAFADDNIADKNLNTLLDHMIYEGKKLYLLKKIIPDMQDTVLYEFKPEQVDWCIKNRMDIWSFIKDKQLLGITKRNEIVRYLNPSPTTLGLPKESPGRAVIFIGYDIVNAFMKQHPQYTIQDLIKEESAQKILDESKYKPKNG
ncbi:MAG: hypothetical protein HOP11_06415 [Saprospiraceae bacterium]|nr:hypothetical protein [Saprospiraceae bacterium]